jgi:Tfp pilus assembly protein PilV
MLPLRALLEVLLATVPQPMGILGLLDRQVHLDHQVLHSRRSRRHSRHSRHHSCH